MSGRRYAAAIPLETGIGLRAPHHADIIAARPAVGWFEAHAENYMGGGPPLHYLEALRRDWPVALHGVGLSLGGAEGLDRRHLERLAGLVERIEPGLVSEHLSWSAADGVYLNDLLPLPYTEEALALLAAHVAAVQDRLGRRILVENPSTYLRYVDSAIPEAEFLAELARRTGCGLLCDVNNIYVTCANHGGDARAYLAALPAGAVGELHLAGHHVNQVDELAILIDDHGARVAPPVWELYAAAVVRFPAAPTLIEWDTNLPALAVLVAEAAEADRRRLGVLAEIAGADAT
ncbi:MAG: MNIO family bufferin maturase [Pseudomonadota bacterium]